MNKVVVFIKQLSCNCHTFLDKTLFYLYFVIIKFIREHTPFYQNWGPVPVWLYFQFFSHPLESSLGLARWELKGKPSCRIMYNWLRLHPQFVSVPFQKKYVTNYKEQIWTLVCSTNLSEQKNKKVTNYFLGRGSMTYMINRRIYDKIWIVMFPKLKAKNILSHLVFLNNKNI